MQIETQEHPFLGYGDVVLGQVFGSGIYLGRYSTFIPMRSRVDAASHPVEILSERLREYASMYVVDGGKKCSLPCCHAPCKCTRQ